jgi:hypothetical protein
VSPRYFLMPWLLYAVPKTLREETLQVIDSTRAKRPDPLFQNQMRLLKNSATKSSFLVGDDHQVCYSDVQEEHTE